MIGIINKGEPDSEFDWRESMRAPIFVLRGLREATEITKISDFDRIASQLKNPKEARELLEDALAVHSSVRLVPVGG